MKNVSAVKAKNFSYIPKFIKKNKKLIKDLKNDCFYMRIRFEDKTGLEELTKKSNKALKETGGFYAENSEKEFKYFGMC
jgi:hypothetical protein